MNPTRTRRHGFTLIELLVVISIIALLIGILLPALGAARASARSVKCLSSLKQVGIGIYAYATDHDQRLVPAQIIYSGADKQHYASILGRLGYVPNPNVTLAPTSTLLANVNLDAPALTEGNVFYCNEGTNEVLANLNVDNDVTSENRLKGWRDDSSRGGIAETWDTWYGLNGAWNDWGGSSFPFTSFKTDPAVAADARGVPEPVTGRGVNDQQSLDTIRSQSDVVMAYDGLYIHAAYKLESLSFRHPSESMNHSRLDGGAASMNITEKPEGPGFDEIFDSMTDWDSLAEKGSPKWGIRDRSDEVSSTP